MANYFSNKRKSGLVSGNWPFITYTHTHTNIYNNKQIISI